MINSPIGFLDSGSGGLSVWQSVTTLLPHESTVYVGDHANIPYSTKTTAFIQKHVIKSIDFLCQKKCKLIVIACNTSTVAGIDMYRTYVSDIPIVGVVPVVKTAASLTKHHAFAVLSTIYTSKSTYIKSLIHQFAPDCTVKRIGVAKLVTLIEQGKIDSKEINDVLKKHLSSLQHSKNDVLVLGCTHFPFVSHEITKILGNNISIIDSGMAVARQVERILAKRKEVSGAHIPMHYFYTTGDENNVSRVASTLLKQRIIVKNVQIA